MKNEFVCSICGKTFNDINEYCSHVVECTKKENKKIKEEKNAKRLEKLNESLNKVKAAKKYFEDQLEEFKNNYPEEYELNFGKNEKKCSNKCSCHGETTIKDKDGKVTKKEYNSLEELRKAYPEIDIFAKLLGLDN